MLSDLPSDLRVQSETKGSPPAWFHERGPYFFPQFYGFNGNPEQILHRLKYNQEMPKNIPPVARRYTKIDPLSPMFRADLPKYNFGDISGKFSILGILAISVLVWLFFIKK